jgi:hypothetical protein
MVEIEFIHAPTDRIMVIGPFPFVQFTYDCVRVGEDGGTTLATFRRVEGLWLDQSGLPWTDVTIRPAPGTTNTLPRQAG